VDADILMVEVKMEVDLASALRKLSLASPIGVVTFTHKLNRKIRPQPPRTGL
jgi:hypothetical protein